MGKTYEFLGTDWIKQREAEINAALSWHGPTVRRGAMKNASKNARALLRWIKEHRPRKTTPAGNLTRNLSFEMEQAQLMTVQGMPADQVRKAFHDIAKPWIEVLDQADWKRLPKSYDNFTNREAKPYIKAFKARVSGKPDSLKVSFRMLPQLYDALEIIQSASISGDHGLARAIAKRYRIPTPAQAAIEGDSRCCLLRELILGNNDSAAEYLKDIPDGYPMDWPPERIELPKGIIENDPAMILRGVKAINARFNTTWNLRLLRQRFEKLSKRNPKLVSSRRLDWDTFLNTVRRERMGMKWLVSSWANSFLNIAAWRGMTEVFAETRAFSEWVPLELCKPVE